MAVNWRISPNVSLLKEFESGVIVKLPVICLDACNHDKQHAYQINKCQEKGETDATAEHHDRALDQYPISHTFCKENGKYDCNDDQRDLEIDGFLCMGINFW